MPKLPNQNQHRSTPPSTTKQLQTQQPNQTRPRKHHPTLPHLPPKPPHHHKTNTTKQTTPRRTRIHPNNQKHKLGKQMVSQTHVIIRNMRFDMTDRIEYQTKQVTILARDLETAIRRWQKKGWIHKSTSCHHPNINGEPVFTLNLIKQKP